jgi:hypothetical protein
MDLPPCEKQMAAPPELKFPRKFFIFAQFHHYYLLMRFDDEQLVP